MKKGTIFERVLRWLWTIGLVIAFGPFFLGYEYHPFSEEASWTDVLQRFEAWAQGSVTKSYKQDSVSGVGRYRWDVTSSEHGTVWTSQGLFTNVDGTIWQIKAIPDDHDGNLLFAGNATPTNGYNVEIRGDYLNEDLVNDATASCGNVTIKREWPTTAASNPIVLFDENINVYCSGMGNTTKARVDLLIKK